LQSSKPPAILEAYSAVYVLASNLHQHRSITFQRQRAPPACQALDEPGSASFWLWPKGVQGATQKHASAATVVVKRLSSLHYLSLQICMQLLTIYSSFRALRRAAVGTPQQAHLMHVYHMHRRITEQATPTERRKDPWIAGFVPPPAVVPNRSKTLVDSDSPWRPLDKTKYAT
jgi:hypothetical protein